MCRNTILEMLRRPVRADQAMKIAFALVALGAGVTATHALTKPAQQIAQIESAATLKPVILAIDWQESGHGDENGAVAIAYAR